MPCSVAVEYPLEPSPPWKCQTLIKVLSLRELFYRFFGVRAVMQQWDLNQRVHKANFTHFTYYVNIRASNNKKIQKLSILKFTTVDFYCVLQASYIIGLSDLLLSHGRQPIV
jgi:hypothetical protein